MTDVSFRRLLAADWPRVREIYAAGIATGDATFETEPPDWARFDSSRRPDLRLVVVDRSGRVVGWAAGAAVSARPVYAGVVEHGLYVDPAVQGGGVGRRLLAEFVDHCEDRGVWTLHAGVFPENQASLAVHERCGFRRVGVQERLGAQHGRWRDVILLERRSTRVGTADC